MPKLYRRMQPLVLERYTSHVQLRVEIFIHSQRSKSEMDCPGVRKFTIFAVGTSHLRLVLESFKHSEYRRHDTFQY